MAEIIFPEWESQNSQTAYPFQAGASLSNAAVFIPDGVLIDAILYPIGATGTLRLSGVDVAFETVTIWIGDDNNANLASGTFALPPQTGQISLNDAAGRPAGLIVASQSLLSVFAGWGTGTQTFTAAQTAFAATVCVATAETGVRGILLDDGTLLTGEVWIVGGEGVVLNTTDTGAVRVDVVGDPLFRRALCIPQAAFATPSFVKSITIVDSDQSLTLTPDAYGNVGITVNNDLAVDTVLRIRPTSDGNVFELVGPSN